MNRFYVIVDAQVKDERVQPIFIAARANKEDAERVAKLYRDNYGSSVEIWDYAFDETGRVIMGGI